MMTKTLGALCSDEQLFLYFFSVLVQSQLVLLVYIPVS